jgi:hypothetical protein
MSIGLTLFSRQLNMIYVFPVGTVEAEWEVSASS